MSAVRPRWMEAVQFLTGIGLAVWYAGGYSGPVPRWDIIGLIVGMLGLPVMKVLDRATTGGGPTDGDGSK